MQRVATIAHLGRYPVKSMRGESPEEVEIGWNGVIGDRRYAFVRANTPSGHPWLTGRQDAQLILYSPRFKTAPTLNEPDPDLWVRTPDGDEYQVDDPRLQELLERQFGHPLYRLHLNTGTFDAAQLSLIGLPTLQQLSGEVGQPLERERFRANLYLATEGDQPAAEDQWVGRVLAIGGTLRVGVTKRNVRCVMTTLDPATAAAEPAVLQTIAQQHQSAVGIYASVLVQGAVRVGDPVYLLAPGG